MNVWIRRAIFRMVVGLCLVGLVAGAAVPTLAGAVLAPQAGQVLVLMDVLPFTTDNTSVQDLLDAAGVLYDVAGSDQMATVDLGRYPAVIVVGHQPTAFYEAYQANAGRFNDYVDTGGYLEFHAGGWNGTFDGLVLPGGVTITQSYNGSNWIADLAHPVVAGVPNPFGAGSRAVFTGSVPGMNVIINQGAGPGGLATLVEYAWGAGRVIAFGQPIEYLYAHSYDGWNLLPNAIGYMAGQLAPNVYVVPGEPAGFGVAGQEIPYAFTVMNGANITGTFDLALSGNTWLTELSSLQTGSLGPGETETVMVTVTVSLTAVPGEVDGVTMSVTSTLSPTLYSNAAVIRTTAASGDYGFVMGLASDQIVRVDRGLDMVAGRIYFPAMTQPQRGVLSPSGDLLYASLGAVGAVAVIDTATNTVENTISVGTAPRGMAVTHDGGYVLVANMISDNVSVINTATQAVSATLGTGNNPESVATHPCQDLAYVAASYSGEVYVIDTAALTVTDVITGLGWPMDVAVSPSGQFVYVSEEVLDSVAVIDTSMNEVVYRWPAGAGVSQLDVSPDGRLLYVTDGSANAVSVLDALSGEVLKTIALNLYYGGIEDVQFAPAGYGPYAYITASGEQDVITINTNTHTVEETLDVGVRATGLAYFPKPSSCLAGIVLAPARQVRYGVAGELLDYSFRVSNATTETRTIDLSLAGADWAAALSDSSTGPLGPWETFEFTATVEIPAGAVIGDQDALAVEAATTGGFTASAEVVAAVARPGYVFEPEVDRIALVDTVLHEPTGEYIQMPASSWPWRGTLSPDGETLYASLRDTNQVAVIDLTAPYTITLIPVGAYPYEITLSPDGGRAFVVGHDDNSLSVIDTASLTVTQVITGLDAGPISVETSPCLDKIYVASKEWNSVTVLDGTTLSVTGVITAGLYQPWGMAVSPLGDRVYVSSVYNMDVVVIDTVSDTMVVTWTMNLPGSENLGSMANLDVSPDGLKLYAADPALGLLYVVDTQTGEVTDQIQVNPAASGAAWDVAFFPWPYDGIAYVSIPYADGVRVVDTEVDQVIGTISLEGGPRGLALFPEATICGTPPEGSFTQSATTVLEGEGVVFTATVSAGVPTPTVTWDFGDGSAVSHDLILTHVYTQTGLFTVALTIENPLGQVVLTGAVTVLPIVYGVSLEPAQASADAAPGETAVYTLTLTNLGNVADSFTLSVQGNAWQVTLPAGPFNLEVGASAQVIVTVLVPTGIADGQVDVATIIATSAGDAQITDAAELSTTGRYTLRRVYLPVINK